MFIKLLIFSLTKKKTGCNVCVVHELYGQPSHFQSPSGSLTDDNSSHVIVCFGFFYKYNVCV